MFSIRLNKFNPIFKKAMTFNKGVEMVVHKEITKKKEYEILLS